MEKAMSIVMIVMYASIATALALFSSSIIMFFHREVGYGHYVPDELFYALAIWGLAAISQIIITTVSCFASKPPKAILWMSIICYIIYFLTNQYLFDDYYKYMMQDDYWIMKMLFFAISPFLNYLLSIPMVEKPVAKIKEADHKEDTI